MSGLSAGKFQHKTKYRIQYTPKISHRQLKCRKSSTQNQIQNSIHTKNLTQTAKVQENFQYKIKHS